MKYILKTELVCFTWYTSRDVYMGVIGKLVWIKELEYIYVICITWCILQIVQLIGIPDEMLRPTVLSFWLAAAWLIGRFVVVAASSSGGCWEKKEKRLKIKKTVDVHQVMYILEIETIIFVIYKLSNIVNMYHVMYIQTIN
jgi:hypothetical protein